MAGSWPLVPSCKAGPRGMAFHSPPPNQGGFSVVDSPMSYVSNGASPLVDSHDESLGCEETQTQGLPELSGKDDSLSNDTGGYPASQLPVRPWGRLAGKAVIELLPREERQPGCLNEYIIGRSSEADVIVPHKSVSGKHARLWCERVGPGHAHRVFIEDLSSNGTIIRTAQNFKFTLRRGQRRELHSGDEISLVKAGKHSPKMSGQISSDEAVFMFGGELRGFCATAQRPHALSCPSRAYASCRPPGTQP